LLDGDMARDFLCEVANQAREKNVTSDEHFTFFESSSGWPRFR